MTEWLPVIVALAGGLGASLAGLAALRKADAERDRTIVDSATGLVEALDREVCGLRNRLDIAESRLQVLEHAVRAWDGWADRVLDILDRALGMLATDKRERIAADVAEVKRTRPAHRKHLVEREP